jgi:hypothetical protein
VLQADQCREDALKKTAAAVDTMCYDMALGHGRLP